MFFLQLSVRSASSEFQIVGRRDCRKSPGPSIVKQTVGAHGASQSREIIARIEITRRRRPLTRSRPVGLYCTLYGLCTSLSACWPVRLPRQPHQRSYHRVMTAFRYFIIIPSVLTHHYRRCSLLLLLL